MQDSFSRPRLATAADVRAASIIVACLPLAALFGWLMVQRLATCPKHAKADFAQEWTSVRNFWSGRPIYLSMTESVPLYFGSQTRAEVTVNAHPPTGVLVAIPFGLVEYQRAWWWWNVFSLAALGASLWLLMRPRGLNFPPWTVIPLLAALLASNPLAQQVIEGQLNLLLLLLFTSAWVADRQGWPKTAGMLIGLATAIKLFPGLLLVYFVARRQWSAVAAAGVTCLATACLAMACFGSDVFVVYVRDVMPQFAHFGENLANCSLPGLWNKLFVGTAGVATPLWPEPRLAKLATLASGLAIAVLCGYRASRATTIAERDLAFALGVVGALLASPITWGHAFVLLTLPLLVVWRQAAAGSGMRWLVVAAIGFLWLVRPNWIWNYLVPGFEALSLGVAPDGYRIPAIHALSALSIGTYGLVALFAATFAARPSPGSARGNLGGGVGRAA
ncbi:MAG: glycosyltransferase family 87 protein [Pirellulaceae bacterium]|nr:glycosyltransferase family 87 protein [Pirellulaceae bacterium]